MSCRSCSLSIKYAPACNGGFFCLSYPVSNCEESAMLLPTSGWNTCGLLFACYLPTESPHGVSRNWGGTLITDRWSTILSPLPAPTVVSERKPQHTSNGFTLRPTMHRRRFHRSESSPLESSIRSSRSGLLLLERMLLWCLYRGSEKKR